MFYIFKHSNKVNTLKLIDTECNDMSSKAKMAAHYITSDNDGGCTGKDNLYLDIIHFFGFNYNQQTFQEYHPNYWDNTCFKPWLSYIQGKRRSKMTEERYKDLFDTIFRDIDYHAHTFFMQDKDNEWQFNGICNFVLFNTSMTDTTWKQFYFYGWNKDEPDMYLTVKDKSTIELHHTYDDMNTDDHCSYQTFEDTTKDDFFVKHLNLPVDTDLSSLESFDYLQFDRDNGNMDYHYMINFKKFVKYYDFTKDLTKDEHCHVFDVTNPEIRKMILENNENMFTRVKELMIEKINAINFIS